MSNVVNGNNPTEVERQFQRTAVLYMHALKTLRRPVSNAIKLAAKDPFCKVDYAPKLYELLEKQVSAGSRSLFSVLVELLTGELEEHEEFDAEVKEEEERLILARLALWWVNHRVAFLKRKVEEDRKQRTVEALRASARAKLTPEERKAIGLE